MPQSRGSVHFSFLTVFLILVVPVLCFAQAPGRLNPPVQSVNLGPQDASTLIVHVQTPDGKSFEGTADVALLRGNDSYGIHQVTHNAGQADFPQLGSGFYYVVVTADGYKPSRAEVNVSQGDSELQAFVRLQSANAQSSSIDDLLRMSVAPRVQADLSKGIEALRAKRWDEAQSRFENVYKTSPQSAGVNYLLGFTFLERGSTVFAERYLLRAASLDPRYAATFAALGELRHKQSDLSDAVAMYERAVELDAQDWHTHWSLAAIYLDQGEYAKARSEGAAAVQAGRGAAVDAGIIVAEASAALGDDANAIDALTTLLRQAPDSPSAPAAKELLARIQAQDEQRQENAEEIRALAKAYLARPASTSDAARAAPAPTASAADVIVALPIWAPQGVDEIKPAVSSSAVCSVDQVVAATGANISRLATNIGNIDASEQMLLEQLDETGKPAQSAKRRYDYVANFEEVRAGNLTMNEYRNGSAAPEEFPGKITTTGMTSMALVFHPYIRADFQMTCEGLGDWHGHPAWIVYFRQREGVPGRLSGYKINGVLHRLDLKGRAWITADTFQVAHVETDLVKPMPEIQLMLEHMSVDYSPVAFKSQSAYVWLPEQADLYFEFHKQRLHTRDTFSRYKLYSVGTSQKINQPPATPAPDLKALQDE